MERKPGRPWTRRLLLATLLAITGATAACWVVQSPAFEGFLVRRLPGWGRIVGLRLEIGGLDVDLGRLSITVEQLRVERLRGDWSAEARRVSVGLNLLKSLAGTPHLRIEADSPRFRGAVHLAEKSHFKLPDLVLDTVLVTEGGFSLSDLDSGVVFSLPAIELRWLQGRGWGRAAGGGARWKGVEERLGEVSVVGSRRMGILHVDHARLSTDRLRVSAKGRMGLKHLLDGSVDVQVLARNLPDAWVKGLGLADYSPVDGAVAIQSRLTGRLEEPRFRGAATLAPGRFGGLAFQGGTFALEATEKELGFAKLALQTAAGAARGVSGKLSWARGLSLEARGEALDYDLRSFMVLFVKDYFPVGVKASGTFEVNGPLYPKLDLSCKVEASGRDLDVTTLEEDGATTWFSLPRGKVKSTCRVAKDHLVFGPTVVDGGTVVVRMSSGRVDYETGLDFNTDVEVTNLDLVRQYLPEERGPIDVRGRAHGRMKGPYEALTFDYRLDLASTTLWGRPMGLLTADATFDLRDLVLKKGVLQGPMGRFEASGKATLRTGGPMALEAVWTEGDLTATAALIHTVAAPFPEDLRGSASAAGRVVGTIDEPVFEGSVTAGDVRLFGADVDEARGEGALGLTRWKLDRLTLWAYGARVDASGRADLEAFEAAGTTQGLSLAKLDKLFGRSMPVGAVFAGNFRGHGPYADPVAELSGVFTQGEVTGYALGGGTVTGELKHRELSLDARVFSGAGKALVRIGLEGQRPLVVDAEARDVPWERVPRGLVPEILQGDSASGRGRVLGALSEGVGVTSAHWEGTVAGARAKTRSWTLGMGELATRVGYDGRDLQVLLDAWNGEATADLVFRIGESEAPMKTRAQARNLDLSRLSGVTSVPAGRVSGVGEGLVDIGSLKEAEGWKLLGAVRDLAVSGTASGVVGPEWIKIPTFKFTAGNPGGRPELDVRGDGFEAHVVLEDLSRVAWNGRASLQSTQLGALLPEGHRAGPAGGVLDGQLRARGADGKVFEGSGQGEVRDLTWGPFATSRWSWSAKLDGGIGAFEVKEPRGITANGTWGSREGLRAALRLEAVPLAGWTKAGQVPEDFRGAVTGSGEVRRSAKGELAGSLRLRSVRAELPPFKIENREDVVLSYGEGAVRLDAVNLSGDGFDLRVGGRVVPLKSWDVKAKGRADLALLARGTPKVRVASGGVVAEVAVSGPWKAPAVEGPVEVLPGGRLGLEGLDHPLEDVKAKGYFEGGRGLLVDWLDARFGEGRIHAEGLVGAEGLKPKTLRFLVEARDIAYEWPRQVTYQFDGDGIITGTPEQPELRGEVRLKRFRYTRRVNWKSMVFDYLKRRPREVESTTRQGGAYIDVSVRGAQDLKIENNLADLFMTVDLRAKGALARPALLGRVESREGTVRFRTQEYEVLRSAVEFLGETQPVPLLDLHARTTVQQYTVNVDVDGPLDKYQVNLSSSPALAQNDLVRLLSVGAGTEKISVGSESTTATQRPGYLTPRESKPVTDSSASTAVEATSFLTGLVQDELESQVTDLLGFDQFQVDPAYSTSNQTTVPRVTVGKAITRALFARYSTAIGGEVEQDLEVQYTLTPAIQLLGTWSDKGAQAKGSVGGKVRFRFTFR